MTTPTWTSEPRRLLDEPEGSSSLEQSLLKAGKSAGNPRAGSQQMQAKVLAGLGLAAGSTALLTGSAAASATASVSTVAKLTWGKLLLGGLLVSATAVPVGYYALHHTPAPVVKEAAQSAEANAPAAVLLREELAALDHARLALAGGNARRALEELEGYDRRFPGGRLQLEAEVLRIDALAKLGRKDAARQRAEVFLRRHPNSVLTTRVRAHVAD